ncbi:hypothetical protein MASR1M90_00780 [Desulfovibrionales bacterium]
MAQPTPLNSLKSRDQHRGFTLVEMLVLMIVTAILIAMSGTALMKYLPQADLKFAARTITSICQHARMEAIKRNVAVEVRFSSTDQSCIMSTNNGTVIMQRFSLSEIKRGGINFGHGTATRNPKNTADITDNLPPGDKFSFNGRGRTTDLGTVYIQNTAGHSMAIVIESMAGSIRVWSWQGNTWK